MTKISEATFNELKETFDKAIQEAFGAGKKSVEQEAQMDAIKVGDNVRFLGGDDKYNFLTEGTSYEVLEKKTHPHEDIPVLRIEDNRRSINECSLIRPDTVHLFEVVEDVQQDDPTEEPVPIKSPNQQRSKLNQRAREFVDDMMYEDGDITLYSHEKRPICTPEFIVNRKNRMVTVLLRGYNTGKLYAKGIAKCAPGDVFNGWIGKSIALARALEIEIPSEFLNAVQPDEKDVGMLVRNERDFLEAHPQPILKGEIFKVVHSITNEDEVLPLSQVATSGTITDDTNAEYANES